MRSSESEVSVTAIGWENTNASCATCGRGWGLGSESTMIHTACVEAKDGRSLCRRSSMLSFIGAEGGAEHACRRGRSSCAL